ncbi:endonuclease/exonuclease/phosphatase family protein [Asanoa sp. NPDC050611]|uniref:endonuclease/exonuclease/phosphatase family protein n=1 Tax=Asanoa sp. NPDC050611 TaxID=3157098 RepID=UPI0033DE8D54
MADLRVLTLNLWARHGDWHRRRDVLAAGIRELAPDLVAAQEVLVEDGYDQLADVVGDGFHVVHQTGGHDGLRAVSVASRWPVGRVREADLRVTDRIGTYPCATLLVEVLAPAPLGRIILANHGPAWQWWAEAERERQAVATARAVEELVGELPGHVVAAGDFNAEPGAASMRFWTGRQSFDGLSVAYRDAWESARGGAQGWTFDPRNPLTAVDEPGLDRGRRIDYVLVRCTDHGPTLRVRDTCLAFSQDVAGVWASDHFGVVADLALP